MKVKAGFWEQTLDVIVKTLESHHPRPVAKKLLVRAVGSESRLGRALPLAQQRGLIQRVQDEQRGEVAFVVSPARREAMSMLLGAE